MKLVLTEFLTLDGVAQGPGSRTEDTSDGFDRGGWLVPYLDEVFVRRTSDWLDAADGLLFGRRTYEAFARDWPAITDPGDPFAKRMNTLPKYVVSSVLTEGKWNPTTVLQGDPVVTVGELVRKPGRELQIHGSSRLATPCSPPGWSIPSGWPSRPPYCGRAGGCSPAPGRPRACA